MLLIVPVPKHASALPRGWLLLPVLSDSAGVSDMPLLRKLTFWNKPND